MQWAADKFHINFRMKLVTSIKSNALGEKSRGKFISQSSALKCIPLALLLISQAVLDYQIEKIGRVKWICSFSGKPFNRTCIVGKQNVLVDSEPKDDKSGQPFIDISSVSNQNIATRIPQRAHSNRCHRSQRGDTMFWLQPQEEAYVALTSVSNQKIAIRIPQRALSNSCHRSQRGDTMFWLLTLDFLSQTVYFIANTS